MMNSASAGQGDFENSTLPDLDDLPDFKGSLTTDALLESDALLAEAGPAWNQYALAQLVSLDVVSKVLLGITGILLIRYMGAVEYAHFTTAVAVLTFVSLAFAASFNRIYIVAYERMALASMEAPFLAFQLLVTTIALILVLPFRSQIGGTYAVVALTVFATLLIEYGKTTLQQRHSFGSFAVAEMTKSLMIFAGTGGLILFIGRRVSAQQAILVQGVAIIVVFLALGWRKLLALRVVRLHDVKEIARAILGNDYRLMFCYFVLAALLAQIPVAQLRGYTSSHELATFGSAFRYYMLLSLVLNSVHTIMLPHIVSGDENVTERVFAQQRRLLLLFTPIVLISMAFAGWVLPWVDQGKFPGAVGVYRVLALSAIVSFAWSPSANLLLKREDFRFLTGLMAAGVVIHLIAGKLLIKPYHAIGAALSVLITYAIINGLTYLRGRHFRTMKPRQVPFRDDG